MTKQSFCEMVEVDGEWVDKFVRQPQIRITDTHIQNLNDGGFEGPVRKKKPKDEDLLAYESRRNLYRLRKRSLHLLDSRIEKAVVQCDAKLLILDPLQGYLGERIDMNRANEIRAVKKLQAERGERLGGRPAYGYKKVDEDSKEIIPDDEAAAVVQRIFSLCVSGKGPNQIARICREDKVLTPSNYYFQKHKKGHIGLDTTRPYAWSSSTVTAILDNKVYLGHTVGLRTTTISYKNKTTVHRLESECAVVENTHPALITQEQWDIVQDVRTHKKRTPKQMEEPNIFSGLAYCADCKRTMVLHRASTMKKSDYNAEQREIDEVLPLKEERLEKLKSSSANVDAFIEKAKRYKTIDKLTPEIVRLFIARIEIGEPTVKYSRHSAQKIRVIYRDIGEWDYDDAAEAEQQQPQIVAVTVAQPELLPA